MSHILLNLFSSIPSHKSHATVGGAATTASPLKSLHCRVGCGVATVAARGSLHPLKSPPGNRASSTLPYTLYSTALYPSLPPYTIRYTFRPPYNL